MKEIGGYFGLESLRVEDGEYHKNCVALNTARNALVYLARAKNISRIFLPYFLCDSVSMVCQREGISYAYYHTGESFRPVFSENLAENDFLYVVNFYGQLGNDELLALKYQYNRIIVDNTHAFFQPPIEGIDTIYSCRKFFGVSDGAYLFTDCRLEKELPTDYSEDRTNHIFGRIRDGASAHYEEFKANDEKFKTLPLMNMSELTHRMLSEIDYKRIRTIREENYLYLHKCLGRQNRLRLITPLGPYAYPFYCENGMEVKKKLAEYKYYVATLWPNVLELDGTMEKDFAENILPLPCDQRYGEIEMQIIAEEMQKYV